MHNQNQLQDKQLVKLILSKTLIIQNLLNALKLRS